MRLNDAIVSLLLQVALVHVLAITRLALVHKNLAGLKARITHCHVPTEPRLETIRPHSCNQRLFAFLADWANHYGQVSI
jgi:hypothetical protein